MAKDDTDLMEMTAAIVDAIEADAAAHTATLSNGIVLRIKTVPPFVTRAVLSRLEPPAVPTVYNPDKEREEPNPLHPNYLAAMERYAIERVIALGDLLFLKGTEVESVPEGKCRPEDDEWVEELALLNLEVSANQRSRYLAWIKFYALATERDIAYVTAMLIQASGLSEEEVQRAIASFRSAA